MLFLNWFSGNLEVLVFLQLKYVVTKWNKTAWWIYMNLAVATINKRNRPCSPSLSFQEMEVQHLLQQLHLANSEVEELHQDTAQLRQEAELRSQQPPVSGEENDPNSLAVEKAQTTRKRPIKTTRNIRTPAKYWIQVAYHEEWFVHHCSIIFYENTTVFPQITGTMKTKVRA